MFYVFLFSPLALIMEWLAAAGRCSNEAHGMLLPSAVKTSGFFAPLNCFGQQDAINSSLNDIKFAAKKAATAADETFLVKPVNIPMPQALSSSRLLVVHNDAAAKAAAHLHLAYKILKPYRTVDKTGLAVSETGLDALLLTVIPEDCEDRQKMFSQFIYCVN